MDMINTITVDVTENDIEQAIKTLRNSPLEIAAARALKVDLRRLEVKLDEVIVWMYDDSYYVAYNYQDEDSYVDVYDFINEWELFTEDKNMQEFAAKPITFTLEKKHDPRTDSRYWAATSLDPSEFNDRPSSDKKNSRNRLTKDDEWV